jgi:cullin 1
MSFLQHQDPRSVDLTVEQTWKLLEPGVKHVYRKEPMSSQRYVELYSHVYQYCTCNNVMMPPMSNDRRFVTGNEVLGERLYEKLRQHLDVYLQHVTEGGVSKSDECLLDFYVKNWDDYTFSSNIIHHLFTYLNRHWVRREQEDRNIKVYEIYSMSLMMWRETLLKQLRKNVTDATIKLFRRERNGETIKTSFLICVRDSYVNMGVCPIGKKLAPLRYYRKRLEKPLIEETRVYYTRESSEFLEKNPISEYIKKALLRLDEEKHRVEYYLHTSTMTALIQTCEDVLIKEHLPTLFEEFRNFLLHNSDEDMGRLFKLVSRTPNGLQEMKDIFQEHIRKQGNEKLEAVVTKAINDPPLYIDTILAVYRRYKKLVLTQFHNHHLFAEALDQACEAFINKNAVTLKAQNAAKSPELLARYCDYLLKKNVTIEEGAELRLAR